MFLREESDRKIQISLILIEIGGEEFAIDLLDAKEIIQAGQIRRLPRGFDFIEGIYNYRGNIIHIINPKKKLKINNRNIYKNQTETDENSRDENEFIIIISLADNYIGFLVDRIINVTHVNTDDIEDLSPILQTNVDADCIKGIIKFKDRPRVWLNLKKVLSESEQISIQKEINY
ncbi:MAG: chemotaxis protein CheW [Promethearchaeota archaeon]